MNNANCELRVLPDQRATRQHGTQTRTTPLSPHDEAIRDFFRRGDRGQYEGGPADHNIDSLPNSEVPERAPIVRTPRQQARRLALMRFEAVLLAGCVGFLVAAARSNASDTREPLGASAGQAPAPQRARIIAQPLAAVTGPSKASATIGATANSTGLVSKAMPVAQVPTPKLAVAHQAIRTAQSLAGSDAGKVVLVRSETPKATLPSIKYQREAKVAAPALKTEPASARSVARRVAVATFPDD